MLNPRKAAVIGCGFVGASIAFSLMQKALFSELVLIDTDHPKAEGEAMDLSHGLPYTASMDIYAGDYSDLADCALVIITAIANRSKHPLFHLLIKNLIINSLQTLLFPFKLLLLILYYITKFLQEINS